MFVLLVVQGTLKSLLQHYNSESSINDSKLSDDNLGCTLQPLGKLYIVEAMVFPVSTYSCESWTIKKAERQKIDAFEL